MQLPKRKEQPQQIQLELPDYSQVYWEWKRKKDSESEQNNQETVVIIDIY